MNKHLKIVTSTLVLITLLTSTDLSAQRSQVLKSGLKWIGKVALKAAVTEVTLTKVRQYFNETPHQYAPVSISITNNYNTVSSFKVSLDGYNWYNYSLYPNYYYQFQSTYQGALVVYRSGSYYMVSESGSYSLSRF